MSSVAIVVLDTLRYDSFRDHFGWLDGTWFINAYSTSHWTGSAHASLFTGRYPSEIGTTIKSRSITCEEPLLTEQLSNAGYTTRIISNNPHIYEWEGWERGFDKRIGTGKADIDPVPGSAVDWRAFEPDSDGPLKYAEALRKAVLSDQSTISSLAYGYQVKTRTSLTSIGAIHNRVRETDLGSREFLLCNGMDTHAPYHPPPEYRSIDRKVKPDIEEAIAGTFDEEEDAIQAYDDCARCVSDRYREFHATLRESFDYVITLGDHGELLGEEGLWAHDYSLRPELTHVPLVISGTGVPDRTVDRAVSLIDVHQTVADIAGVDVDSRGRNLLEDWSPVPRLVEYHGMPEKRRKTFAEHGIGDRYDPLDRPLDGIVTADGYAYETHDDGLRVENGVCEPETRERLSELVGELDRKPITPQRSHVSESVRERLRELGYV